MLAKSLALSHTLRSISSPMENGDGGMGLQRGLAVRLEARTFFLSLDMGFS
jgi:hypothetical protein